MPNITLNIAPFGVGVTNYTLRYKIYGTSTWVTTGTSPSNPIPSTTLNPVVSNAIGNTIYDLQIISNCGANTSQSPVFVKTVRECPALIQYNDIVTDTAITTSFPLSTPAPIANHISDIVVELYQGVTLITSQTLAAPNATNTVTFTGLAQNTTYTVKHIVNFTNSDTYPMPSYDNGGDSNTMVCTHSVLTNTTPVCPSPQILSVTQS